MSRPAYASDLAYSGLIPRSRAYALILNALLWEKYLVVRTILRQSAPAP